MSTDFLPHRDSDLLGWASNFATKIEEYGMAVGLTDPQIVGYATLKDAFAAAYAVTQDFSTRSPASIVTKDTAREALIDNTRALVRIVQGFPGTTDTMRTTLRITVRKTPERQNPPEFAPKVGVAGVHGHTVTVTAEDPASEVKRKKLAGAVGVWWYLYVGTEYPGDPGMWEFCGQSNHYSHDITLPLSLTPGTQVWFTAAWIDRKGQSGPPALPVSANVEYSGAANAQKIKLAA